MPEKGTFAVVPSEASHSFKSSLKHTYTVDTRDDNRMPTEGLLFRCTNELAGLGGDVKFLKQQVDVQAHVPTTLGATLSVRDVAADTRASCHPCSARMTRYDVVLCSRFCILEEASSLRRLNNHATLVTVHTGTSYACMHFV